MATTLNIKLLETGFNFDKKLSFRILRCALGDVMRWKKNRVPLGTQKCDKIFASYCITLSGLVLRYHTRHVCLCYDSILMKLKRQIDVFLSVKSKVWSSMKIFQRIHYWIHYRILNQFQVIAPFWIERMFSILTIHWKYSNWIVFRANVTTNDDILSQLNGIFKRLIRTFTTFYNITL